MTNSTTDEWDGGWPDTTLRLPRDGQRIEYRTNYNGRWNTGIVEFCWCGIEPMIRLTNGKNVVPSLDEWRVFE